MRLICRNHRLAIVVTALCCLLLLSAITVDNELTCTIKDCGRGAFARKAGMTLAKIPSASLSPYMQPSEVHPFDVDATDCSALFKGDTREMERAIKYQSNNPWQASDPRDIIESTRACEVYRTRAHYITKPVSKEEEKISIAYSIMIYRSPLMFSRLLRAIYRPQNYYCVHVDAKSDPLVYAAVSGIARCFGNVILASRRVAVDWGGYTALEPDLICMEQLWEYPDWLYYINLTGEEFPLKTNLELVRIFTMVRGANLVGAQTSTEYPQRYHTYFNGTVNTHVPKPPPPMNVTMAKEMTHVALYRPAVDYILHDPRALAFREWVRSTHFPDEFLWATLYLNPHLGMPGAYTGNVQFNPHHGRYQLVSRLKIWGYQKKPCPGKYQRGICLMSVGHLPLLATNPKLFVNKFKEDFHPLAYDCMEQRIFQNVLRETLGEVTGLNDTYYKDMDFVKSHT